MTVNSLWTVLDEGGCGRPVGLDDFTLRKGYDTRPSTLAVDLSIWICEALSSTALCSFHKDPALYLVYQRTVKLLRLGLGLVFVVEGKRRVRSSPDAHELKQRRSGSQFWSSSERCAKLLRLLGVPVVQANAEGEALCALLNSRGVCDGVISNDGDCFLFGAKTLYTKFTVENLENHQVIRYDLSSLSASINSSHFGKEGDRTASQLENMTLSREDLIAFALMTGSDLLGSGVPHVGYKKAIQLLHACKKLKHRPNDSTCLDELISWGNDVSKQASIMNGEFCMQCDDDGPSTINERCCTICLHPGNKTLHEKQGCLKCGTQPGEGCFVVTAREKFVRSIKAKAMKLTSFANRTIIDEYFSPNNNCIPSELPKEFRVPSPNISDIFDTSFLIKGHSLSSSKDYIRETLLPLLARLELWTDQRNKYISKQQKFMPRPMHIEKEFVKDFIQCYEIKWSIDLDGGALNYFVTTEPQSVFQNSKYSNMCKTFHQENRRRRQELDRQKHFGQQPKAHKRGPLNYKKQEKDFKRNMKPSYGRRRERKFCLTNLSRQEPSLPKITEQSHDVEMLIGNMPNDCVVRESSSDEDFDTHCDEGNSNGESNDLPSSFWFVDPEENYQYQEDYEASMGFVDNKFFNIMPNSRPNSTEHTGEHRCTLTESTVHETNNNYDCYDRVEPLTTSYQVAEEDLYYKHRALDEHWGSKLMQGEYSYGLSNEAFYSKDPSPDKFENNPVQTEIFQYESPFDVTQHSSKEILQREEPHVLNMPILTPSNRDRLFVDMGIQIEVTPIVSRRWR